jgi:hypothetical protein
MLKVPLHQENSGIVTGANLSNDRNITTSNNPEYVQYKLDAALKEIELLKERIKDKEYIIEMLKNKNN